jgi:hypothetical protein
MIEAWLLLPALGLAYLLAGPGPASRRSRQLAVTGVVTGVVSLSWMTAVSVVPAAHRPAIDGSQHNSVYEQVFVYNGFGRLGDHNPLQLLAGQSLGIGIPATPAAGGPGLLLQGDLGRDVVSGEIRGRAADRAGGRGRRDSRLRALAATGFWHAPARLARSGADRRRGGRHDPRLGGNPQRQALGRSARRRPGRRAAGAGGSRRRAGGPPSGRVRHAVRAAGCGSCHRQHVPAGTGAGEAHRRPARERPERRTVPAGDADLRAGLGVHHGQRPGNAAHRRLHRHDPVPDAGSAAGRYPRRAVSPRPGWCEHGPAPGVDRRALPARGNAAGNLHNYYCVPADAG